MSVALIRQFLEPALVTMVGAQNVVISWENGVLIPIDGVPYLDPTLMMGKPDNPTMPQGFHREKGVWQITLQYPLGGGPALADAMSDLIVVSFPRGRSWSAAKITLTIAGTPYASPGRVDGNRWAIPVKIPFFANVFE